MKIRILRWIPPILLSAILLISAIAIFYGAQTAQDLLEGNRKLKAALVSLSHEDQIGFAKVLRQETRDGKLYTTIRFVETARGDMLTPVLEKEYEIEGDVVYFDALIITFPSQMVMDGKARSIYLWRRIYGEHQNPADGFPVETQGSHPERYATLLRTLRIHEQQLFWKEIWKLANNPEALQHQGIKAIYGNAVYKRLKPGLIYVFKIGADGQVYPETLPDL